MIPLRDNIPSRTVPFVTLGIIGVNVVVFLLELSRGPNLQRFIYIFGMVPQKVTYAFFHAPDLIPFAVIPVFTSLFLHGGWLHIIGNMLFLFIFGDNVEGAMGHVRYGVFYLVCGVAASASQILANPNSNVPTVGASGAIAGILGAYFLLFPRARVLTLVPIFFFIQIIEIPAVIFLGIWFFIQFLSGWYITSGSSAGGVAWWAHIGGFAVGVAYTGLKYRIIGNRRVRH